MQGASALTECPSVEGALVSNGRRCYSPHPSVVAGAGQLVAAPGGCAVGRFGWADTNGKVSNARTAPTQRLGIVIPPTDLTFQSVFWDEVTKTLRRREGLTVTMFARADVLVRFAGGAWPGSRVYANLMDGSAIAGYSPDGELTPWSVITPCPPGALAIISTWSTFT